MHEKGRKGNAGAKPFDVVLMFKVLILQQLHNPLDDGIEYQLRDRFSFMRFLGLGLEDRVPDSCHFVSPVPGNLLPVKRYELQGQGHYTRL